MRSKLLVTCVCGMLAAVWVDALAENAMPGKVKICLAGDSTVQTYKPGESIVGWGQVISRFLVDSALVENHAIGGRSTKTFISENRWKKLLASKPDYVLIQFGHNDAHGKDKPESTDAGTDYKANLRTFVDEAKAAGATPILVTPMHMRIFEKDGAPSQELLPYSDAMKEVASEKNVVCVDLHASSGAILKTLGENGSTDLFCSPSDRSHFSLKGAEKMTSLIVDDLKRQSTPLAAYIRQVPLEAAPEPKAAKGKAAQGQIHIFGKVSNVSMAFDGASAGVTGGFAEWMKEEKEMRIVVSIPACAEWAKHSFSFTPKSSGKIMLILMADNKDSFICYDDIKISGATLANGDFERLDAKGIPDGWSVLNSPVTASETLPNSSGKVFVKCSGDNRLNQMVQVEAGKQVEVTFMAKADAAK